jgi:hypothetical protein
MSASKSPEDENARVTEEDGERQHTGNLADEKHPIPLFLRGRNDGRHGNAQDEKDEASE